MRTIYLVIALFYSILASAQGGKPFEYEFSKSVKSAIKRGIKSSDNVNTLYLELSDHKGGYLIIVKNYSQLSMWKREGIMLSSRYTIIKKTRLPIWFKYDEVFYKKQSEQVGNKILVKEDDIEGGGYTIVFNHAGKVIDEYKQQ